MIAQIRGPLKVAARFAHRSISSTTLAAHSPGQFATCGYKRTFLGKGKQANITKGSTEQR
jgi:hypothetical protein